MVVLRSNKNPIIKPEDVKPSRPDFKVICVFNCGVTKFNGEIFLLMRVAEAPVCDCTDKVMVPLLDEKTNSLVIKEFNKTDDNIDYSDPRVIKTPQKNYLTSISHFRIARSKNGVDFKIDEKPAMFPEKIYEKFGIEDPRITEIDGEYYIGYSAVSDITGITLCLASTFDFISFKRHGIIFLPDNKDFALFPEKIGGMYCALNRPTSSDFGMKDIWISQSDDLLSWGNHKILMTSVEGFWDGGRIGCGAVPFKIKEGWLEIYHGASKEGKYCLGAILLDINDPSKIISRTKNPIIEPEESYEKIGFLNNVIFTCGALHENGIVKIYYGAADMYIAYAEIELKEILEKLK
ncbi:MAG: glycoside hydrolase family 130 protein [Candidatus Humimicrobiaceae bacterium]